MADLQTNLGMKGLTGIRVINRYDVMGVTDEEFAAAKALVLSEPPVDTVEEELEVPAGCRAFAVEFLPASIIRGKTLLLSAFSLLRRKNARWYLLPKFIFCPAQSVMMSLLKLRLTALTRLKHAKLPGKNRRL